MNNYINYPKNYNYQPNTLQNTVMPQNMYNNKFNQKNMNNYNLQNLYNPYEGFIRGNMFPSLYDPYKIQKPFDVDPMNEQAEMLTNIDSLGFAMVDLNLYLDVNPDDKNAIELYNQYRIEKNNLVEQYENKFGPLILTSDSLNTYPWAWDNKPWPWDN